jgi:excisionase family DNA binding protein
MRGSRDIAGMPDVRSHLVLFSREIVRRNQTLEMEPEFIPNFFGSDTRLVCGTFFGSSSVAVFGGFSSDRRNGVSFAPSRQAHEIIAPEASHSRAVFLSIRQDACWINKWRPSYTNASSEGERCMKDTVHPIVHISVHPGIFGRVRTRRSWAWYDDQIGHGQNTGLGWSDPTFVHVSVPKIIRGVAPAQLRGDRAECFVRATFFSKGATVMNNEDANHTELLTVHEIARLLKVPVSWVYGHTRKRSIDRLPGYRLGKYWRFRADEVMAWVQRQRRDREAA